MELALGNENKIAVKKPTKGKKNCRIKGFS
jgi:hypothetical protein